MKYLVTGAAGFIGFHVSQKLLARGDSIVGFDNVNDYYDPALKEGRLAELEKSAAQSGEFTFIRGNLASKDDVAKAFDAKFDRVIHLAAQAGVRHSITNPEDYVESNLIGFANILEACRAQETPHLAYASTSSVYGANTKMPFSEHQVADHPLQFYAATKRANELMAHSYAHLFNMPVTGMRFFTVYGPWGRPDMALFTFTKKILAGEPIQVFHHGKHRRDFTYVDDIAEGVIRIADTPATPDANWNSDAPDPSSSNAPFRIYNIGRNAPVLLTDYIDALEKSLGRKAIRELLPMQPGDVPDTYSDTTELANAVDYHPSTSVEDGVAKFVEWYRDYYKV